ncbi:MAG: DUF262 domain-containing protein [bacterium]
MAKYIKTSARSILWFKQVYDRGELEMKPPFQRNPVWTEKQKSYLIDSILNEYPVPEIYMQEIVTDKGEVEYIIVDGQQRIRAVLEYLENKFPIDAKDSPQWGDMFFVDLRSEEKKRIYEYDFVARYLPEIDDAKIREIFGRLNRNNVILNAQELRQATYWGPFIKTMNEIAENENWGKLDIFTSNDIKRMLDVEFISELTIAFLHGHQNKKLTLDMYYQLYENEFENSSVIKELFDLILRELIAVIPRENSRWYKKTDFYSIFLIFARHRNYLPLSPTKRDAAKTILTRFGLLIDNFLSINRSDIDSELIPDDQIETNAILYGQGVRASTDLGSRRRRDDALEDELSTLWNE